MIKRPTDSTKGTTSGQTDPGVDRGVVRVDRRVLRVEKRVLRVNKRVLRVLK